MSYPRTTPVPWPPPAWAHSAQASPQRTNCLGRGLANRSPSGARVEWPRAREGGRPLSYCLQTPAVEIGIPDSRERPLQPPGAGPSPGLLPRKGPSRPPCCPHCHSTPGTRLPPGREQAPNQLGRGLHHRPLCPPGHCQAQGSTQRSDAHEDPTHPAAFMQRKVSRNNLACVLVQQTKAKQALGWCSGVPDPSLSIATESLPLSRLVTGNCSSPLGLSSLVVLGGNGVTLPSTNTLYVWDPPLCNDMCRVSVSLSAAAAGKLRAAICA